MDYKKAYEELIQKLRDAMNSNDCDDRFGVVVMDIVPELAESEDERIRRALIKQFSAISMETWQDKKGEIGMRVGEGRIIGMRCVGCIKAFHYYPHPYCYEDLCANNNPIVYKPSGMGQELKKLNARKEE